MPQALYRAERDVRTTKGTGDEGPPQSAPRFGTMAMTNAAGTTSVQDRGVAGSSPAVGFARRSSVAEHLVVFAPLAVITQSKIEAGCRVWLLWLHSGVRERQPARGLPRTRATPTLAGLVHMAWSGGGCRGNYMARASGRKWVRSPQPARSGGSVRPLGAARVSALLPP